MVEKARKVNQYYGSSDCCAKNKINHFCQIYVDFCYSLTR